MMFPQFYSHLFNDKETHDQMIGLGCKEWAYWMEDGERTEKHIELEMLESAGLASTLPERLEEKGLKVSLLVIQSMGGADALGGCAIAMFVKSLLTG